MRCGRLLAAAGYRVATGGYGGMMAAVSRGAAEAGAEVIAVTAPKLFPHRPGANRWATTEVPHNTLAHRIGELVDASAATIALPGSLGTLTELMVAWNDAYVATMGRRKTKPIVAVGEGWSELVGHIGAAVNGMPHLVRCVATVDEAVAVVSAELGS
jgi:uncharacterized protein (TIGR00725 family)